MAFAATLSASVQAFIPMANMNSPSLRPMLSVAMAAAAPHTDQEHIMKPYLARRAAVFSFAVAGIAETMQQDIIWNQGKRFFEYIPESQCLHADVDTIVSTLSCLHSHTHAHARAHTHAHKLTH